MYVTAHAGNTASFNACFLKMCAKLLKHDADNCNSKFLKQMQCISSAFSSVLIVHLKAKTLLATVLLP